MTLNGTDDAAAVITELEAQRNAMASRACTLALDLSRVKARLAEKERECEALLEKLTAADRVAPDWDSSNG